MHVFRAEEEAAFEQYLDSLPETEVPPEFFDPISFMLIHDPVWDRRVSRSRDSHSTNSDTGAGTRDSGSGSGSERERDRDQKVIMDRNTFERSVLERSVKKYHRNPLTGEKMDLEDIEENTDMRNRCVWGVCECMCVRVYVLVVPARAYTLCIMNYAGVVIDAMAALPRTSIHAL